MVDMMNACLKTGLSENEVMRIFTDVSQAVGRLHHRTKPIIHRDLKVLSPGVQWILSSSTCIYCVHEGPHFSGCVGAQLGREEVCHVVVIASSVHGFSSTMRSLNFLYINEHFTLTSLLFAHCHFPLFKLLTHPESLRLLLLLPPPPPPSLLLSSLPPPPHPCFLLTFSLKFTTSSALVR